MLTDMAQQLLNIQKGRSFLMAERNRQQQTGHWQQNPPHDPTRPEGI